MVWPHFTAASKDALKEDKNLFLQWTRAEQVLPQLCVQIHLKSFTLHPFRGICVTTRALRSEQGLHKAAMTRSTAKCWSSSVASAFFSFFCCSSAFSCHLDQLFQSSFRRILPEVAVLWELFWRWWFGFGVVFHIVELVNNKGSREWWEWRSDEISTVFL